MRRFLLLLLPFSAFTAAAQYTDKIETDRPDQTESPYIVPLHFFQGEFGFNRISNNDDVYQVVHPTSLLKYGLSNRFELRLEISPYTEVRNSSLRKENTTLLEPVELGTKIRLFEEKGLRPKTSLIAHVGLPFTGSKIFRSSPMVYSATVTLQNKLSEAMSLGTNVGVARDVDNISSFNYTLAPGFSITEKWYAYIEIFGSFFKNGSAHNFDGGIAYNLSPHTKIDLSAGVGLWSTDLREYAAVGFSFRLPLRRPAVSPVTSN